MIKVKLIQFQEYGDYTINTSVDDFKGASDLAGLLGVKNEDVEISIRIPGIKEIAEGRKA